MELTFKGGYLVSDAESERPARERVARLMPLERLLGRTFKLADGMGMRVIEIGDRTVRIVPLDRSMKFKRSDIPWSDFEELLDGLEEM